ncbi:MAG: 2-succinyl-5-enolpyruvyl-6-hydroxy-3-cyclohexene-1-carboxylic-acid synthase, partial [Gemmatimonadaceae bacterium]
MKHVCIAPGSRSTPLALTIARHPSMRIWMHLDERSCAFFALGMARMLGEPVALLCTSGTAAANFLPAVVEARSAGVSLLVLTADRPPELRDIGAAQTIDQNRLYGTYAKWFVNVALPETGGELLRYVRTLACRAVARSRGSPPGPVHLNFPFREPLVPVAIDPPEGMNTVDTLAWHGRRDGEPWVRVVEGRSSIDEVEAERLATKIRDALAPLIICGPQFDSSLAAPLAMLAARIGAPLLADPLSQVRWGNHDRSAIIDRYDALLRDDRIAETLTPDLIIRIGGVPTSKALLQYLRRHTASPLVVIDADRWPDPTLLASLIVHSAPGELCTTIQRIFDDEGGLGQRDTEWLGRWTLLDDAANAALEEFTSSLEEPFEGHAVADVIAGLPPSATVFVSSSMPVRDLDAFGRGDVRQIRVLANRGANGIDGV